ncbi:MAG: hypothetical protein ACH37Z_04860 [Anaerolineae bacterium]
MPKDLDASVKRLLSQLEASDTPYLLVGGLALLRYVAGRNTEDIDLVMALGDARRVPDLEIKGHDHDFAQASFQGLAVDLLLTSNALFERIRRRHADTMDYLGHHVPVVSATGLVALKLYALPSLYRQGEHAKVQLYEGDIAMLLQAQPIDIERVFAELTSAVSATDLAELRTIHAEIAARLVRGDRFGAAGTTSKGLG